MTRYTHPSDHPLCYYKTNCKPRQTHYPIAPPGQCNFVVQPLPPAHFRPPDWGLELLPTTQCRLGMDIPSGAQQDVSKFPWSANTRTLDTSVVLISLDAAKDEPASASAQAGE